MSRPVSSFIEFKSTPTMTQHANSKAVKGMDPGFYHSLAGSSLAFSFLHDGAHLCQN